MFGLSVKEKLFKAIKRLTNEKLSVFEAEFASFVKASGSMDEATSNEAYLMCIGTYSDAISGVLAETFGRMTAMKAGMAFQSPRIAGFPDDIDMNFLLSTGPLIGYYFGLYYYAITNNKISLDDYGKFIRPLNQHQVNLINSVISKYDA